MAKPTADHLPRGSETLPHPLNTVISKPKGVNVTTETVGTHTGSPVAVLPALQRIVDELPFVTSVRDAATLLQELEIMARQVEATKSLLAAQVYSANLHRADGYVKVSSWARSVARLSARQANDLSIAARLIADYPEVGRHYFAGTIAPDHVRRLGALHQNKRVTAHVAEFMPLFLEWATTLDIDTFNTATQRWEQLTDADGTHRHSDLVHDDRDASIHTFDDTTYIDAKVGNIQGTLMHEVHQRFCERELQADLAERDRLGLDDLPRTARQRRADALHAIFAAAADTLPLAVEPLVNIVIDGATYEAALRAIADNTPLPSLAGTPDTFATRRCDTVGGIAVDPIAAVTLSLLGQVRRVVMDASSTVIDLGRRSRLFTGASREAIFLRGRRCIWPGCGLPHTQIDHLRPWSDGGTTSPPNGAPLCPRHNRLKNDGYTTVRQADGSVAVHRPDGQPIIPV